MDAGEVVMQEVNCYGVCVVSRIDKEVEGNLEPFRAACEMLTTMPGVSSLAAEVMVSEIGIDMSRFMT